MLDIVFMFGWLWLLFVLIIWCFRCYLSGLVDLLFWVLFFVVCYCCWFGLLNFGYYSFVARFVCLLIGLICVIVCLVIVVCCCFGFDWYVASCVCCVWKFCWNKLFYLRGLCFWFWWCLVRTIYFELGFVCCLFMAWRCLF